MSGYTFKGDILCETAVAAIADGKCLSFRKLTGMDHHCHVDAVEVAAGDEFNFSAEIFDDTLFS